MENKTPTSSSEIKTSGKNITYWLDSSEPVAFSSLNKNITVDALIVGGGIAGITTAYCLSKEGLKVAVVEDGNIGSGETGRTTAHLVNALDDRYYDLEKTLGKENVRLAAESHTAAINFIENVCKKEKINCEFERLDGYLFLHPTDKPESLEEEHKATTCCGIKTEMVNTIPGIENVKGTCLKFPAQAQFHPLKYLQGLCDKIIKNDGKIFTKTHAKSITTTGVTTTEGFEIKAKNIIVATNTPINDLVVMHTKQAPYRTYVIGAKVPKGSLPKALWWDTGDHESKWPTYPYHYVRTQNYNDEFDLLICGGEDHKTGQADAEELDEERRYYGLEMWAKKKFPAMQQIIYRWSGQVMEPVDSLAYIGRNPLDKKNIFIVTGDSGNGMTHGTIAGMLLTDLIMERKNPWEKLYDPGRITLKTAGTFISENVNVAKQFTDYLTKGDLDSVKDLANDEGAVIREGLKKIAVYRDRVGTLHTYTAICPHLQCVVAWNGDEKTFDCPCHGSRFSCYGKVMNGPANTDLEKVEIKEEK